MRRLTRSKAEAYVGVGVRGRCASVRGCGVPTSNTTRPGTTVSRCRPSGAAFTISAMICAIALNLLWAHGAQAHGPLLSVLDGKDLQGLTRFNEKQSDRWAIEDLWHSGDSTPVPTSRKPHLLFTGIKQWLAGKLSGYHGILSNWHEKWPADTLDIHRRSTDRQVAFGPQSDALSSTYSLSSTYPSSLTYQCPDARGLPVLPGNGAGSQPSLLDCESLGRLKKFRSPASEVPRTMLFAGKDPLLYSNGDRGFDLESSGGTSMPGDPSLSAQPRLWPGDNPSLPSQDSQARSSSKLPSNQRTRTALLFLWLESKSQRLGR